MKTTLRQLARRVALSLPPGLLALPAGPAAAQTAPTPPPACQSAEYRQFDFWIGTWDVFLPNGQRAGENRIEPIAGQCALLENWSGRGGVTGKSLNIYDRDDKRWHQTWVDGSGGLLMLAGGLVDKRMVMASEANAPNGAPAPVLQRIAWTPNDDGSVRQLWESSADGGKSWTVQFDGKYVRRP
ncbi:MAG: hypothetical protein ACXWIY_12840 [Caldimonas sp.]